MKKQNWFMLMITVVFALTLLVYSGSFGKGQSQGGLGA